MDDSPTGPVGPPPKDPYDKYYLPPVQGDQPIQQEAKATPAVPSSTKRKAVGAYLRLCFKKILALFTRYSSKSSPKTLENTIHRHLVHFKTHLELLKKENRSEDLEFFHQFAHLWQQLFDDLSLLHHKNSLFFPLEGLIKQIESYPSSKEHSLGYYLSQNDKQWLPFPYIEIIKNLHDEYIANPQENTLSQWTLSIQDLIKKLSTPTTNRYKV